MTVMITTVYECFPPPSRLSVVMDGARRRFFLPLPSSPPLDFPIRREQMLPRFTRVLIFRSPAPPLLSSHPPLQFPFYYKKRCHLYVSSQYPLIFVVHLIFTQPCLQLLKLRRTEFIMTLPYKTQEHFVSSKTRKANNVSLLVHSAATTFAYSLNATTNINLMQLNATDTTNETQLT